MMNRYREQAHSYKGQWSVHNICGHH